MKNTPQMYPLGLLFFFLVSELIIHFLFDDFLFIMVTKY